MARYGAWVGIDEAIAKLGKLGDGLRADLRGCVRSATNGAAVRARTLVPVRGGGTRDAIAVAFFDGGDTGSVFVGPSQDPRTGRRRADNLPLWIEYGTTRAKPSPFLRPAGSAEQVAFERDCIRAAERAAKLAE